MILHPKLKKFEIIIDERDKAIDLLKLEYAHERSMVSPMFVPLQPLANVLSSKTSNDPTATGLVKKSILSQCFDKGIPLTTAPFNPEQEIEDYLNYDCQLTDDDADDIDILRFWREHKASFPTLASIARRIFSIPATNTTIERLFSLSKNTVTERRTNLDQEKLNRLMFLQKNLPLLKQLEDTDAKSLQVKRSISISTVTSIERQSDHTGDGLLSTCTTKPKKRRSENEHAIVLLDHESGSDSNDVEETTTFFNLHSLFADVK